MDKNRKVAVSKIVETKDFKTGEVISQEQTIYKKVPIRDDFIMVVLENLAPLVGGLSNPALKTFLFLLKSVNFQNIFHYSTDFVNSLVDNKILSRNQVYRAISELIEKQVLLPTNMEIINELGLDQITSLGKKKYLVNPALIGKVGFNELGKLKQTVEKYFDFSEGIFKLSYKTESSAEGEIEKIKNEPHKILEANEIIEKSSDGKNTKIKQNVLIDEQPQEPQAKTIDAVEVSQEPQALPQLQGKSDKEMELELTLAKTELLREQNRAKELSIKEKELNFELKKLEKIENSDLAKKIIDNNPLWFDQRRADVIDALGDRDRDENL